MQLGSDAERLCSSHSNDFNPPFLSSIQLQQSSRTPLTFYSVVIIVLYSHSYSIAASCRGSAAADNLDKRPVHHRSTERQAPVDTRFPIHVACFWSVEGNLRAGREPTHTRRTYTLHSAQNRTDNLLALRQRRYPLRRRVVLQ